MPTSRPHAIGAILALVATAHLPAQWSLVPATGAPSARLAARLVADLPQNRILLFGGNATNETWSYANGAWAQLTPANAPSARSRCTLVGDPLGSQIVLYGGLGGGRFALDDTWTWTGTDWLSVGLGGATGGRFRHAMGFDGVRQAFVLFGGRNDTWASTEALADTFEFANGAWIHVVPPVSPSGRLDPAMAFLYTQAVTVLFGGDDGTGTGLDDTWTYDGATWTQVAVAGPRPSPRAGAQMVPVLSRGVVRLVGGRDPATQTIRNDTWEFDGSSWRQLTGPFAGMQPARADFGLVHDVARDRTVAFGGELASGGMSDATLEFGAQFTTFGTACAGSAGAPRLALGTPPRLGAQATVRIEQLLASAPVAAMAVGLNRTNWALGALPATLTPLGLTGCTAYTSLDAFVVLPANSGLALWQVSVPNLPALFGTTWYLQGLSFDPGRNAAGLVTSDAAALVFGY